MRVLMTGGAGFLGRRVVQRLLAGGASVRCLLRRPSALDDLRGPGVDLEIVEGSLAGIGPGSDLARGCEVVVHAAADLRGGTAGMFLTNVVATRGLIEAAGRSGVSRLVLVSSLGVYGTGHLRAGQALDETCPLDPEPHRRDPYTYSKVAQERAAWSALAAGTVPLVVVRPSVIYGPGRDPITGRVGLRLGGFLLGMGGRHRLPYIYVDNCAEGVALAATAPAPGVEGEAFDLVDDELPTGRQVLRAHRRAVGGVRAVWVPRPAIGALSRFSQWYHRASRGQLPAVLTPYKSDAQWKPLRYPNAKAKRWLGWSPAVGLAEGMKRTTEALARPTARGA